MQNVDGWPTDVSVSEPVARVLVDGQPVEVSSLSVSSSLDSVMPEVVAAGGGGVVAATGDTSVLPARDVVLAGVNPWGLGRQIADASEIILEAGYRDADGAPALARLITAQVESMSGAASSAGVDLSVVDRTRQLDRDITIEPLLINYPPLEDWGPRRGAGLSPLYVTDRILRHCGYYATPPMGSSGVVLSAPLMGSAWPERGTLESGWANSNENIAAVHRPVHWGLALSNAHVTWRTDLSNRTHGRLSSPLTVSFLRRNSFADTPTDSRIELYWGTGDGTGIRIDLQASGSIVVRFRDSGSIATAATLSAVQANDAETFQVRVTPAGQVTISTNMGASVTGSATVPALLGTGDLTRVYAYIHQASHPIGGLQVAFNTTDVTGWTRTAHLDEPAWYYGLAAFPFQHNKNCLELLKEQAEAELAAMWIDEHGHFQWRNRNRLRGSAPVGTLTSLNHLMDLPWEIPARSVYSRVEVETAVPDITSRPHASITVHEGGGNTLSDGDTQELFIDPPSGQDWHGVDAPQWLGAGSINPWAVRRGRGSYRGGVLIDEIEVTEEIARAADLSQSWSQVHPQQWKLSSSATGINTEEYIEQRFASNPEYGRFMEEQTPIIRARGTTDWSEETVTGSHTGPELSPVFTHRVGPWVQEQSEIQDLADWLSLMLTRPDVVLKDIPIVPDPRIQKGDVFWLQDDTAYGVRLRVVVVGINLSLSSSGSSYEMSQSITCRVISSEVTQVTLADHDEAWKCSTLGQHDSFWADATLAQHDANPLANNNVCAPLAPTLAEHDAVWSDATLAQQDAHWDGSTLAQHDADPLDR